MCPGPRRSHHNHKQNLGYKKINGRRMSSSVQSRPARQPRQFSVLCCHGYLTTDRTWYTYRARVLVKLGEVVDVEDVSLATARRQRWRIATRCRHGTRRASLYASHNAIDLLSVIRPTVTIYTSIITSTSTQQHSSSTLIYARCCVRSSLFESLTL